MTVIDRKKIAIVGLLCFFGLSLGVKDLPGQNLGEQEFRLVELESYGKADIDLDSEYPGRGAAFASISDVAVSRDGRLLVLDSEYMKVVVFGTDGNIENVIMGGEGRGPGEFQLPNALAVDPDNTILVYDYILKRISYFSMDGENLDTKLVNISSKGMVANKGNIWFANLNHYEYFLSSFTTVDGDIQNVLPATEEDLEYDPSLGVTGWVGRSNGGDLLLAAQRPGIWYRLENGNFGKYGSLLVDSNGAVVQGMWITPGANRGINGIGAGYIGLLWSRRDMENLMKIESFRMEIYRESDGRHLGSVTMPFQWISAFTADPGEGVIYAATNDPFPRVVKYRIERVED